MNNYRVLLVEDDSMIAKSLQMSLSFKGFEISNFATYQEGLTAFQSKAYDLVLLDVNLPDGNGLSLCREIRQTNTNVPVMMLTAQTDEASAVRGFEEGADDYIRKPYGVQELTSRMLRLLEARPQNIQFIRFGSLRVDPKKRLVWANDTTVSLGKREFEILSTLLKKSDDIVTRADILTALGDEAGIFDRTIDSHLSHLRKKLRQAGAMDVQITPVYGVGYRLEKK